MVTDELDRSFRRIYEYNTVSLNFKIRCSRFEMFQLLDVFVLHFWGLCPPAPTGALFIDPTEALPSSKPPTPLESAAKCVMNVLKWCGLRQRVNYTRRVGNRLALEAIAIGCGRQFIQYLQEN